MYYLTYITMAAANNIGAGLAAIGLTGAGIGIGSIFSSLISSTQPETQPFEDSS
jgi:F0F1-type ATP synthase membrane subunit c/vacuolar-type H+-ATPase subunit K